MKAYLTQLIQTAQNPLQGRHLVREYLQARILSTLQRVGAMIPLAFHGGTALRFLYNIPRYSEDLDFALEHSSEQYDFRAYLKALQTDLTAEKYVVEVKVSDQKVVHGAFVRFRGLLHELDLSPHTDEVLSIKLEVDTQPPKGATLETTVVRRRVVLHLQHHDRASLLAGKLHAILQRPYTKGRDWYDLLWYLSAPDWPLPNLELLNHALQQTNWRGEQITQANWRGAAAQKLSEVAWRGVVEDVRPFLMDAGEVALLTEDHFLKLLGQ
jgi:hypothetical protein